MSVVAERTITVSLSERELRALVNTVGFDRDVLTGLRTVHPLPFGPGEAPLEVAHGKLVSALERHGVRL